MRYWLGVLAVAIALPALAQEKDATIDPGMSRAQVVERLGSPVSHRSDGALTFLYYRNGCEKTCGMQDLVILEHEAVVDAIFRASYRHYSGKSSSPRATPRSRAARGKSAPLALPATATDSWSPPPGVAGEPAAPAPGATDGDSVTTAPRDSSGAP